MRATRTATKLADGRELIYYDEQPGRDRSAEDLRDLGATRTSSEIRYDPLLDQWVVIASHRQQRTYLPTFLFAGPQVVEPFLQSVGCVAPPHEPGCWRLG